MANKFFNNPKTSIAGIVVVVAGAIASLPVGHPFPEAAHDTAKFILALAAGIGLHFSSDKKP